MSERLVTIRSLWSSRLTDGAVGVFRAGWAVPVPGPAGPNLISDATAVDPALSVEGSPAFLLGVNAAGTFVRRVSPGAGSGDVVGPASSFDNAVVRMDGTTGKLVQQSGQVILGDDGGYTRYGPGITPATTVSDAAYAAAVPNGTTVYPEVFKSLRPESLPDWRRSITVNANPSGSVPDVVASEGWNVAAGSAYQDATKPGVWRASECYYNPAGTYRVVEHHQIEGGWPSGSGVSARWWGAGARRVLTAELFDAGGFGGYGVPVTLGADTDVFALRSNCPSQAAYGGSARNIGADYFRVSQGVANGDATILLTNTNLAAGHTLTIAAQSSGASLIQADNRLSLVSSSNVIWLGSGVVFLGPFTPSTTADGSAANGTVYRSSTKSAVAYKNTDGTVYKLSHRPAEVSGRLTSGSVYPIQGKATVPVSWTLVTLKGESGSGNFSLKLNGSHVTGSPVAFTTTQADTVLAFATAAGDLLTAETDAAVRMTLSGTQQI